MIKRLGADLMKILTVTDSDADKLQDLVRCVHGKVTTDPADVAGEERYLYLGPEGLSLVQGKMELKGDFMQMYRRVSGGHLQHEKLLRAAKWKGMPEKPLALDATAGLGEDSFILAAAGYHVILCEYNPVICALLRDALDRALRSPDEMIGRSIPGGKGTLRKTSGYETEEAVSEIREIASRMELREGDSIEIMADLEQTPDLIYLDPMFPVKQKSGISTKKLQIFQKLEMPCLEEDALLDAAFAASPGRIIVKRPIRGMPLAGRRPGYSIECRNVRYDCYLPGTGRVR